MTVHALDNDAWGIVTSCFACEKSNERGLRVPFEWDDERNVVSARFNLGPEHTGAPGFLHGGVVSTLLDEAMAWAAIVIAGEFAVTRELRIRFDRPVPSGVDHTVEAQVRSSSDGVVELDSFVRGPSGSVHAEATATFVRVDPDRLAEGAGAGVADLARSGDTTRVIRRD